MKIFYLALAAILFLVGCETGTFWNTPKYQINRVLHERSRIAKQHPALREYAQSIRKIDVSRCPEAFQKAWKEYVFQCDAYVNRPPSGNASIWKQIISRNFEGNVTPPMVAAWQEVERQAAITGADYKQ